MKKILLINSSKRKKKTYNLVLSVENILKNKGYDTEIINLHDYNIEFCRGCEVCVLKDRCIIKDDTAEIMQKIVNSDGLVIATPVYLNNMSGILKSFIDRTCKWFHRSEVSQKPTLLIADTQGSGIENTLNSIEEVMIQWGVSLCETIGRKGSIEGKLIKEEEIKGFLDILEGKKNYKPTFKQIYTYNIQRVLATNVFELDNKYWSDKNWINNLYFPNSNVSLIKRIYGNFIYKMLCKVIKPIEKVENL